MNQNEKKAVYLVGGTGYLGSLLCRHLSGRYAIIVVSRSNKRPKALSGEIGFATWDGHSPGHLAGILPPGCIVINLAGQSIAVRWTTENRRQLIDSRISVTAALAQAVDSMAQPPSLLIQASGTGYYGPSVEQPADETAPLGRGFLADLCRQWEQAWQGADQSPVRRVIMRLGVVLGNGGGFLARAAGPFYPAWAVQPGRGDHYLAWIHEYDLAGAVDWFIRQSGAAGIYNLTAPEPAMARDLYRQLARSAWLPWPLPVPSPLIRLLFGEMAREAIFSSQWIVPRRLLNEGFSFAYPGAAGALLHLLSSNRGRRSS